MIIALRAPEHLEAAALMQELALHEARYPVLKWFFAIPNGEKRSVITAGRLKRTGVKSGVSDYMLPCAVNGHHGLFLELKAMDEKPSPKQYQFLQFARAEGYAAQWVRGAKASVALVLAYLAGEYQPTLSVYSDWRIKERRAA